MLGAQPDATPDELRQAWLLRTRVLHPDRWDARTHPVEWEHAGRMLAELNEAYEVLRDPVRRARYDAGLPDEEEVWAPDDAPRGTFPTGRARFADLPPATRRRLLDRQAGRVEDQFRVRTGDIRPHSLPLALFPLWLAQLVFTALERRWTGGEVVWQVALTAAITVLAGRSLERVIRWRRAALKPYFYFTPLYLIRTELDDVWFWPIRSVLRCDPVRAHRRGGTRLEVVMEAGTETVVLPRPNHAATIAELIHLWSGDLRHAESAGGLAYLAAHDDFRGFDPAHLSPPAEARVRDRIRILGYGGLALVAALVLVAAWVIQNRSPLSLAF